MSKFIIEGGHALQGDITPQGAKNEALEVICATLLTDEEVTISNVPDILDINNLIRLLQDIGVKVKEIKGGRGKPATDARSLSVPTNWIWTISRVMNLCRNALSCAARC